MSALPTAMVPRRVGIKLLASELAAFQPLLGETRMETVGGAEPAAASQRHTLLVLQRLPRGGG